MPIVLQTQVESQIILGFIHISLFVRKIAHEPSVQNAYDIVKTVSLTLAIFCSQLYCIKAALFIHKCQTNARLLSFQSGKCV